MSIKNVHKLFILIFIHFIGGVLFAEAQSQSEADELLKEAAEYFDQSKETEALDAYLKVLEKEENNFQAMWHTSLLYARIGYRMDEQSEMMDYYEKALTFAERVLEKYPERGESHFVYAVANGRISDISGSSVRIEKSHVVKKHAEKAVEMMPDYAPAWHLLGLWHSKVANVGRAQRLAAGVFSKGLPDGASNQKAEEYINKAIELNPEQSLRYKLDLAIHYQRAGSDQKAIRVLKEVVQIEATTDIDQWNLERAEELLAELSA